MKARLIEDGGGAASDAEEFFRAPPYLQAERVTHTLAIDDNLHLPVIVRQIDSGERFDAISPYGYPGARELPDDPPDPDSIDWSRTGLVSVFLRDRIGERRSLAGGTLRSHVHVAEGPDGIRKRLREQIRRNERRGWKVAIEAGAQAGADNRSGFERAYAETMSRTSAPERYLFESRYFDALLSAERAWLLTASPAEAAGALAGAIAVASDGYLHYFLGGTADAALGDSPMKNLFAAMIELGRDLGLPLSLGGGVTPGDSLDDFKRGFATGEAPWYTHEVVCDPSAYEELAPGALEAPRAFFPAYRT